jgi:uncharacterized protein (DUF2461 family)
MTHLCSRKVTHTENTIWKSIRKQDSRNALDIIHAEGVRRLPRGKNRGI